VRECYIIAGRGSGKSSGFAAPLACYYATRDYPRAPGEIIYIGIFAPDRKQAAVTLSYIKGLLRDVPELAALIKAETKDSVTLHNGVVVEVLSATIAAPRGRSYGLVIVEEAAFLPQDQSANPDVELLRAVRPALARVPGSLLVVISSPYARRGILWQAYQKFHEQSPPHVLFVQRPTVELNPTFDRQAVETAYAEDPASAGAEYGAQFRTDVESFLTHEAVAAAVSAARVELAPMRQRSYAAFIDFAGGAGQDSAALAIAHEEVREGRPIAVLDAVREIRPPFSPDEVCAEFATLLKSYDVVTATADRFAAEFAVEAMGRHDITLWPSERSKSEIFVEFLPLLNSRRVELLDLPRLHTQLVGLERRPTRGGRDSIDHAPGAHDDLANATAGALVEALAPWSRAAGVGRAITERSERDALPGLSALHAEARPSWMDVIHGTNSSRAARRDKHR
jgi:hypothetical protein